MPIRREDSTTRPPKPGEGPVTSEPPNSDIGDNTASELIEAPVKPGRSKLDPHDFADGGGGGGGEAFSRRKTK